jgi:hypothetical protein
MTAATGCLLFRSAGAFADGTRHSFVERAATCRVLEPSAAGLQLDQRSVVRNVRHGEEAGSEAARSQLVQAVVRPRRSF